MWDASTLVPIPAHLPEALAAFDATHPEYGLDAEGRPCFRIDSCIVPTTARCAAPSTGRRAGRELD